MQALQKTIDFLSSREALASIKCDPYWPKWNSPWWHMVLMHELGLASQIPKVAIVKLVEVLKKHYLSIFPIREEELPKGLDPYRQVACFCAVGNIYQTLFAAGVEVDQELPWMREWFLRYQLPDGGLNCDERVYTRLEPKSSIVSTIACLEAVFFSRKRELTLEEKTFLTKGADYLLAHKLFRKISTNEVIDQDWLEIRFPRFYEYDYFRGFYFLAKWSEYSGREIPKELIQEVKTLMSGQLVNGKIVLKRYNLFDKRSYNPQSDGTWKWGETSEFELMKEVSFSGRVSPELTKKWNEIEKILSI